MLFVIWKRSSFADTLANIVVAESRVVLYINVVSGLPTGLLPAATEKGLLRLGPRQRLLVQTAKVGLYRSDPTFRCLSLWILPPSHVPKSVAVASQPVVSFLTQAVYLLRLSQGAGQIDERKS